MYLYPQFDEFITLVDECLARGFDYSETRYIESLLGCKLELPSHDLTKLLYAKIRAAIVGGHNPQTVNLRQVESALYQLHHFQGSGYAYYEIPAMILFSINENSFTTFDDRESWTFAIHATLAIIEIDKTDKWGQRYIADIPPANAALRIKARGYNPLFNGRNFYLGEEDLQRYCEWLDNHIRHIGGAKLIVLLLGSLQETKKHHEGRYLLGRPEYPTVAEADFEPGLPWGYLIHLALRHMEKKSTSCSNADLELALTAARDLVGIMCIQDYSQFGSMFLEVPSLPLYLSRTMLADSCLSFRQLSPSTSLMFMEQLFNWVDKDKMKAKLGWDIDDALSVARAIDRGVSSNSVNCLIPIDELRENCGLGIQCLNRLLPHFLHKTSEINSEFRSPIEWGKVNYHNKPFIWHPGNKILIVTKSFAFLAFYEALAIAIKGFEKNCDDEIGKQIEPMVGQLFTQFGIKPAAIARKFISDGIEYESDIIVASENVIILGEIKKKGLTRPSMSGDALDGIIDLSLTFIKAQTQLAIQEKQLLKMGFIEFSDGEKLFLEGRSIERIAITLHDLGSVQDRMIAGNIIKTLINSTTTAEHATPYQNKRLKECNDLTRLLNEQTREIMTLRSDGRDPLFDCTFLGVPQIMFLLNGCTSADEFHSNLRTIKTSVRASFDMYDTFVSTKRIREQARLAEPVTE